ncbi:uncharacterized protein KY384_001525 [Bacidia gigantensis]|uniref:uncharacterized protein n=1 Tax=Bacidia gigantensis TaxID=2732470 RepID=UPI001D04AEB4|nr:uncharacterized protein KY384_001525 [Bacidia gigantensis]KAG8533784.1 hypothetical protein KY384_001525 [Bacidia gigantensis]
MKVLASIRIQEGMLYQGDVSLVQRHGNGLDCPWWACDLGIYIDHHSFPSSAAFDQINSSLQSNPSEQKDAVKKGNAVFSFNLKNAAGDTDSWHIDLKKEGKVGKGEAPDGEKADVIMTLSDEDFGKLATGKTQAQRLFMSGKLKIKGDVMKVRLASFVFIVVLLTGSAGYEDGASAEEGANEGKALRDGESKRVLHLTRALNMLLGGLGGIVLSVGPTEEYMAYQHFRSKSFDWDNRPRLA